MRFTKLQATGNDFILIDARNVDRDWSKLSKYMCDRHFGVGADGLILVNNSSRADLEMRIFNADGSEAEMCGNGLRCFTKYVVENNINPSPKLTIATLAGVKTVQAFMENEKVNKVKVNMGFPKFHAEDIPVILGSDKLNRKKGILGPILDYPVKLQKMNLTLSFVSMGNPHAVMLLSSDVSKFPLTEIGPLVEKNVIFPQKVNFEIAQILDRATIRARVWERGVGETMACGSGACAIAVIAKKKGLIDNEVDIMLHGGTLIISQSDLGDVFLTGPAEVVFIGEWLE